MDQYRVSPQEPSGSEGSLARGRVDSEIISTCDNNLTHRSY